MDWNLNLQIRQPSLLNIYYVIKYLFKNIFHKVDGTFDNTSYTYSSCQLMRIRNICIKILLNIAFLNDEEVNV